MKDSHALAIALRVVPCTRVMGSNSITKQERKLKVAGDIQADERGTRAGQRAGRGRGRAKGKGQAGQRAKGKGQAGAGQNVLADRALVRSGR